METKGQSATTKHSFKHHTWGKSASRIKLRMDNVAMSQPPSYCVARTKTELKKWGFVDPATNTTCQCGADDENVQHRLKCSLLDELCFTTDLCQLNENARRWVELWKTLIHATPKDSNTYIHTSDID